MFADLQKAEEENKKKDMSSIPNWVNFVKALLYYFIVTLLMVSYCLLRLYFYINIFQKSLS